MAESECRVEEGSVKSLASGPVKRLSIAACQCQAPCAALSSELTCTVPNLKARTLIAFAISKHSEIIPLECAEWDGVNDGCAEG